MSEVVVIGAGPAGMAAAIELQQRGLSVMVVDDQPLPGGRIFAAIETREAHGADDRMGADLVARFRESGGTYLPQTETWQIESGPRLFVTHEGRARMLQPRFVLLATGAQERPMPFSGWQLPGVMTVGAAQILLKTAKQIPVGPVWLAGSGPLLLLYAHQLVAAGGRIGGILDTTPAHRGAMALKYLPSALRYGWRDLARGAGWLARSRGWKIIRDVASLEATGEDRLQSVRYVARSGACGEVMTNLLFVHDGVVPGIHATSAAGCDHKWNSVQRCFEPSVDAFGRSSNPAIFVAGDGATIRGARAAILSGKLAALGIAHDAGKLPSGDADTLSVPLRKRLAGASNFRNFIDAVYPPVELSISDETLVCRCEEVTARHIRDALRGRAQLGPDGVKIATRAGMGPCQGRQCGLSITRLVGEMHGLSGDAAGFVRIRPPLKPLTLGELASLEIPS